MSFALKDIAYGWKIGIAAVLTGGITIYTAVNVQNRITQQDAIQVIIGTVERCYATQLTTTPTYSVNPPVFVRTWYDTNGASVVITNTIDWRTDRAMMIDLDAKIIALCPFYVDTNSVYNGTTNIVMHTFTGLLVKLNLGDGTNFTSIPAIGTNAAVYGPWAWRNYRVAWQERYKMLNAMEVVPLGLCVGTNFGNLSGAQVWGNCINYHGDTSTDTLWQADSQIGVADGTLYDVQLNSIPAYYQWPYEMKIGKISGDSIGTPFRIYFRNYSWGDSTNSAGFTLVSDPSLAKIWNCILTYSLGVSSTEITYDESSVTVSFVGSFNKYARFGVLGTITPQFTYCTNRFWE